MSEHIRQRQPCLLKYLVRGVAADRSSQQALTSELGEMLNHVSAVTDTLIKPLPLQGLQTCLLRPVNITLLR